MENLDIERVGEPRPSRDPSDGPVPGQNLYKIATTSLPASDRGYNWFIIFNEQLQGPLVALHDRNQTITVHCDPGVYPDWLERVDAAIKHANEKEETLSS